jgi:hypothetical protein
MWSDGGSGRQASGLLHGGGSVGPTECTEATEIRSGAELEKFVELFGRQASGLLHGVTRGR